MNNTDRASAQEIVNAALNRAGPDIVITHEGCFAEIFREAAHHFPNTFGEFRSARRDRTNARLSAIINKMAGRGYIERLSPTHFRATSLLFGISGASTYNHLPPNDQAAVLWVGERISQTFAVRE